MKKMLILLLLLLPGLNFAQTPEEMRSKSDNYAVSAGDLKSGQTASSIVPHPADYRDTVSVFNHLFSLNRQDSGNLSVSRSGNAIVIAEYKTSYKSAYSEAYKYGDVVFLIGNLDDNWTNSEWTRYYGIAKWLVKKGFRVIINPVAMVEDIKAAVQDKKTKVIIWSSHGTEDGTIYDSREKAVPTDVFAGNAGLNLKQIIVSACYSEVMVRKYQFPKGLKRTHWEGTTDSNDLFNYLYNDWDPRTYGENTY